MSGFRDLIEQSCRRVSHALRASFSSSDMDAVCDSVRRFSLMGLFGFLALGRRRDEAGPSPPQILDLTKEGISKALAKVAERKGIPISPDRMGDVADLLLTGQLCEDVASGVAVVLHTAPEVPFGLAGDLEKIPQLIPALVIGVSQDLLGSPHLILDVISDLKDGRLDSQHRIMTHTLKAFFRLATADSLITLFTTLLGPEYETFRLAVIVYAGSQGIQIDEEDLDRLREALDPSHPDLGPLLASAYEQLMSRYPEAGIAQRVLHALTSHPS